MKWPMSRNPVPRILAVALAAACLAPSSLAPDPQVTMRKVPRRAEQFDEAAYRVRREKARQELAVVKAKATTEFEKRRGAFELRQAVRFENEASRARSAIARLKRGPRSTTESREAQIAEIRREAAELYRRSRGASAEEIDEIDRRARELVERLHRLGVGR